MKRTSKTTKDPKLDAIERRIDELVGEWEPDAGRKPVERWGRFAGRAAIGVVLAVAAGALVAYILHHHLRRAQTAPAPHKPVPVLIVPAQK